MSLRVLRGMKQQAGDGAREAGSANRPRIGQRCRVGGAKLIDRSVEGRGRASDEFREGRRRRRRRLLRVTRRFLRLVQALAACGRTESIG
jgi:hypothetical protein